MQTMAKLLPLTVIVFLLYTSSTFARLDSPAKDVKKDVINRLTAVPKGGLSGFPANILLPTDTDLDESDDSIHIGLDVNTAAEEEEETVPSVFEDKEPDFRGGNHELPEEQIVSSKLEDKEPEGFRSTRPLTAVNLRAFSRFNPINRRFDHNGRRHHNIRRQIPVQQRHFGPRFRPQRGIEQERDNMISLKKDVFLPPRELPARWIDRSSLFPGANSEFPVADRSHRDEGMMVGEFKHPSWFLRHRRHHRHHNDREGEKVEVEEKEGHRGREHQEREDDGVFKKIRKFLTRF